MKTWLTDHIASATWLFLQNWRFMATEQQERCGMITARLLMAEGALRSKPFMNAVNKEDPRA